MPSDTAPNSSKALLPLRFIVVGCSISGLAAAYALRRAGHQVLVLEQGDGTYNKIGGLRSPPNMTRLLDHWGVGDIVRKIGYKCTGFRFLNGETAEYVGQLQLYEQLMQTLRADYYTIQYPDLRLILFNLATESGVEFRYNSRVVKVDPHTSTAFLSNGEKYSADLIVGADGYSSVVRHVVLGQSQPVGVPDTILSFNAAVPTELMEKDDDLRPLLKPKQDSVLTVWLHDVSSVFGFRVSDQCYCMVVNIPLPTNSHNEDWDSCVSAASLRHALRAYGPAVTKLINLACVETPTKDIIYDPFELWTHDSGRLVLVGHAAHPMMPNGTHNTSMSIEDAVTLGNLFSRVKKREQIPLLLAAYEDIRQQRCATMQQNERQNRAFVSMPLGPEQEARDQALREVVTRTLLSWNEADDEFLHITYDEYIQSFTYDANEMADDWWTKWGTFIEKGMTSTAHNFRYQICVSRNVAYHLKDSTVQH